MTSAGDFDLDLPRDIDLDLPADFDLDRRFTLDGDLDLLCLDKISSLWSSF